MAEQRDAVDRAGILVSRGLPSLQLARQLIRSCRLQRFAGRAFGPGIAFLIGWDILRPKGETAMRRRTRCFAAAVAVLALAAHDPPIRLAADEPKGEGATANKLLGTWKLVSAKYGGRESTLP